MQPVFSHSRRQWHRLHYRHMPTRNGTAAQMHLAVAMPELLGPSDVSGVLYNAETLITETLPRERTRRWTRPPWTRCHARSK